MYENTIMFHTNMMGGGGLRLAANDSQCEQDAGCCECGNELPDSIKCGEFLD